MKDFLGNVLAIENDVVFYNKKLAKGTIIALNYLKGRSMVTISYDHNKVTMLESCHVVVAHICERCWLLLHLSHL